MASKLSEDVVIMTAVFLIQKYLSEFFLYVKFRSNSITGIDYY